MKNENFSNKILARSVNNVTGKWPTNQKRIGKNIPSEVAFQFVDADRDCYLHSTIYIGRFICNHFIIIIIVCAFNSADRWLCWVQK